MSTMTPTWEDKVAEVRRHREASLTKVQPPLHSLPSELPQNSQNLPSELLTPREIAITEQFSVGELLSELKSRRVSVEEVTRAFLRRAAVAQASVCFIEVDIRERRTNGKRPIA